MIANSLVNANCKALNCESSNSSSSADGQEAKSKTVTLVSVLKVEGLCFTLTAVIYRLLFP